MRRWRTWLATVLAPATGPLIYGVGKLLGSGYPYTGPGYMEKHLMSILWLMSASYPVSIGLGVPIVATLYFTQRLTGLNCIIWALLTGASTGVVFRWVVNSPRSESTLSQGFFLSLAFAVIAGLTALVFCLIAGLKMKQHQQREGAP